MKFGIEDVRRIAAALVAVVALSGCAVSVNGTASLLKKDAREAERAAADALSTAKLLLASGRQAADVEQIIRGRGLDAEAARRIVALAQADLAQALPPSKQ